jgi:hypothetical protein
MSFRTGVAEGHSFASVFDEVEATLFDFEPNLWPLPEKLQNILVLSHVFSEKAIETARLFHNSFKKWRYVEVVRVFICIRDKSRRKL